MDPENLKYAGLNDTTLDRLPTDATVRDILRYIHITNTAVDIPIEDRFPSYHALSVIMGVISGLLVVSRICFKFNTGRHSTGFGLDDLFLIATLLIGALNTVNVSEGVGSSGLGKHIWTLGETPDTINNFLAYFLALTVIYFALVMLIKLAALAFFLRIFPSRKARRSLKMTMGVVTLYGLTFVLVGGLQCLPIDYYWTGWDGEHHGTCVSKDWIVWTNAVISILLDLWIMFIPLREITGTTLEFWKKLTGGLMLSLGLIMTFVSSIRLWYLVRFKIDDVDPTWHFIDVSIWSTVEINVGIWCLCVPTLRLMFLSCRGEYKKLRARLVRNGGSAPTRNGQSQNDTINNDLEPLEIRLEDLSNRQPQFNESADHNDTMGPSPPQIGDASRV